MACAGQGIRGRECAMLLLLLVVMVMVLVVALARLF